MEIRVKIKNEPGEPIVNRKQGAIFYCLNCGGTYAAHNTLRRARTLPPQCKCEVYVSADTLKGGKSIVPGRGKGHPVKVQ